MYRKILSLFLFFVLCSVGNAQVTTGLLSQWANQYLIHPIPQTGFTWDTTDYDVSKLSVAALPGPGFSYGSDGYGGKARFNQVSTALTAPAYTFYVNAQTGSDSNNGLTALTAFQSLSHSVTIANTHSMPTLLYVAGGMTYNRSLGFTTSGTGVVSPSEDLAIEFTGGYPATILGGDTGVYTWTQYASTTLVTGQTFNSQAYWIPRSNVNRVVDRMHLDAFGAPLELLSVANPDICATTPNSWCQGASTATTWAISGTALTISGTYTPFYVGETLAATGITSCTITAVNSATTYTVSVSQSTSGTTLTGVACYAHRIDGSAPVDSNTYVLLGNLLALDWATSHNYYIGPQTALDGVYLYGYDGWGVDPTDQPSPGTNHVFICEQLKSYFSGGAQLNSARAFWVDGWQGLWATYGCLSDKSVSDSFNAHNTSGYSALLDVLSVNDAGINGGSFGSTSNQFITAHDSHISWIDVSGYSLNNTGGSVRFINNSQVVCIGTRIDYDWGDLHLSGSTQPIAFYADNSVKMFCDQVTSNMYPTQTSFFAANALCSITLKNVWQTFGVSGGAGTITSVNSW